MVAAGLGADRRRAAADDAVRGRLGLRHRRARVRGARHRHRHWRWRRRPTRSWAACRWPRRASARPSTTRRGRPAGRSASRCSARSCPAATVATWTRSPPDRRRGRRRGARLARRRARPSRRGSAARPATGSPRPRRRRSSTACTRRSRRRGIALAGALVALVFLPSREAPRPSWRSLVPQLRAAGAGRMSETAQEGRRPGRPRSAAADASIVRATLELLLEGGYRGLTMEQVRAARRRRQGDALPPLRLQAGARRRGGPAPQPADPGARTRARCARTSSPSPGRCSRAPRGSAPRPSSRGCWPSRPAIRRCTRSSTRTSSPRGGRSWPRSCGAASSAASCAPTSTWSWRSTCSPARGCTGC